MRKNVENSRPEVLQILLAVLDGDNFLSRCTAVSAVGRVGGHDAASRKRLVKLLSDPDPALRMESAAALGHMGSPDVAQALLASLAGDPIDDVRTQVAVALSEISAPDSLDSLVDCLANGGYPHLDEHIDEMEFGASWEVRGHALKAIGEIGDPAAVEAVIAFIEDEDNEDLQENGFRVLAGLGGSAARAFLIGQLRSGSALARRRAARVLGRGEGGAADAHILPKDIFDALGNALADATPAVRIAAAQALGSSKDSRASALLIGLLDDADWEVQSAAAELLGAFGGAEIAPHLHPLLNNSDAKFQARIVRILGQVASPVSIEPLEALLESDQEELLFEVLGALGDIGHSHCVVQIAEILDNSAIGNDFRLQVIRTLERLLQGGASGRDDKDVGAGVTPRDKKSLGLVCAILDEALESEDERVVYAALSALIEIEGARAQPRLLTLLQPEPKAPEARETDAPEAPETEAPEEAGATAESAAAPEAVADAAPDEIPDDGAAQGAAQNSTLSSIQAGFPGLPDEAEGDDALEDSEPEFDHHREMLRLLAARLLPRLGE
ncbi:MAG: HEAT repeat domain-containing protein, partial [Rhodospirillaceae bacterium]|nr:HEAT repeat domain-containing protein [Rhodospirillaceae bacterium]